jgi:hypothetical protein
VLEVDGLPVTVDELGPIVINKDGSLSRISNWHEVRHLWCSAVPGLRRRRRTDSAGVDICRRARTDAEGAGGGKPIGLVLQSVQRTEAMVMIAAGWPCAGYRQT